MTPPVLVLGYRRPDLVKKLMQVVAGAAPERLFLACDGPRDETEVDLVRAVREVMDEAVTWECAVYRRYSESNHGCRRAVEGAIGWFFDHVSEGIILEDDCVPNPDFFPYCAELLDRYRSDVRIMHISGDASVPYPSPDSTNSYAFSSQALVWGWATWARAWRRYDPTLETWAAMRENRDVTERIFGSRAARRWWSRILDRLLLEGEPDSWAYRWSFSVMRDDGLCIIPSVNLVSNVGHRMDSTHTFDPSSPRADVPTAAILPLRHPDRIRVSRTADLEFQHRLRGFGLSWFVRARIDAIGRALRGTRFSDE